MIAAKNGYIAQFKTAYEQVEYRVLAKVSGGTDAGLREKNDLGISTSRLVKMTAVTKDAALTEKYGDADLYEIQPVDTLELADAIIAQADDTTRDEQIDYNYVERLTTMPNGIVKNSEDYKSVAIFRIKDINDVKLTRVGGPVRIDVARREGENFVVGANTYEIVKTGIDTYKVVGTILYDATPLANAGAGDILYMQFKNDEITSKSQLPQTGIIYKRISPIGGMPDSTSDKDGFETDGSLQVAVNVNNYGTTPVAKEFEIQIAWTTDKEGNAQFTTYKFDLTNAKMEEAE